MCDSSPVVTVAVFSDEEGTLTSRGNRSPDAADTAPETLRLRAERRGDGDGRVYLILVTVQDESGNVNHTCNTVTVAHDKSEASKALVAVQAAAAEAECLLTGAPPDDFFIVGDSANETEGKAGVSCCPFSLALLLPVLVGLRLVRSRARGRDSN